jgi:hypothetical protein
MIIAKNFPNLTLLCISGVKPFRELLLLSNLADELREVKLKPMMSEAVASCYAEICDGSYPICHHPPGGADFIG